MKFLLLFLSFLIISGKTYADQYVVDSVQISVNIHLTQNPDSIVLGFYYGTSRSILNALQIDEQGVAIYNGNLHEGIYFLILPDTSLYEFLITHTNSYDLTIIEKIDKYEVEFKSNAESEAFASFNLAVWRFQTENDSLLNLTRKASTIDEKTILQKRIKENNVEIEGLRQNLLLRYKSGLLGKYFLSQQSIVIPPDAGKEDTFTTQSFSQKFDYYRRHYFDGIDWNDCRMFYTPVLMQKIVTYLFKVTPDNLEAKCEAIDFLFNLPQNNELRKCILDETLDFLWQNRHKPVHEYLYVYVIENFYLNEKANWVTVEEKEKLTTAYNKIKPVTLNSVAPTINLLDLKGMPNLFPQNKAAQINILVFYDIDCLNCNRILQELNNVLARYNYLKISTTTIYTGNDFEAWKKYSSTRIPQNWINSRESGTPPAIQVYNVSTIPTLYLLNEDNKIIKKNFTIAELDDWLLKYSTTQLR